MRKLTAPLILIAFILSFLLILTSERTRVLVSYDPRNHQDVADVKRLIDKTGATVPDKTKNTIALAIAEHARFYGIKPKNLVAIAFVESSFRPTLTNDCGDHGLMQINWPTWKNRFTRDPKELLNVYKNVEVACKIILINRSMGHDELAAYHSFNDEPKAVYAAKLREVLRRL